MSVSAELWERTSSGSLTWPSTRLARWFFSLLLAAELYLPCIAGGVPVWQALVLLLLTAVITLAVKDLFEAAGVGDRWPRRLVYLLAPALTSIVAAWLMGAAAAVTGRGGLLDVAVAAFVLTLLTLTAAETLRGVELREQLGMRRLYFIGTRGSWADLRRQLDRCPEVQIVGAALTDETVGPAVPRRLPADVLRSRATAVVLEHQAVDRQTRMSLAQLDHAGVRVTEFIAFYEAEFKKVPLAALASVSPPAERAPRVRRVLRERLWRGFEVLCASALLLLMAPILLLAAAAVRLSSSGPALYRQGRVGRDGARLTLLKLRTMTAAPQTHALWAGSEAHRVTRVGRVLRRFRIDELPQLWNVIRGDLALIGPRPEQVPIVERLIEQLPDYRLRHRVRPGLTGWAQVNLGYAGSVEGAVAKLQRDLFYVKRQSLRLDALVLWLTLKTVFAGRGS